MSSARALAVGRRLRFIVSPLAVTLLAVTLLASWATPARAALPGAGLISPLAGVPGNIATPDLTGRGLPDLVVPEFGTDLLAVRINDGHGSFGPVRRYPVGLKPSFIAVGDFNRDGHLDLAVSNAGSGDVSVLLGKGDGTLVPARNYSVSGPSAGLLGLSTGSFSIEAVDLTGSGILDLVTSNSVSNDVSVLMGNGDGTFQKAMTYPIAAGGGAGILPFALSVVELDGDHAPDLVVGGIDSVTTMENDGQGHFHATGNYFVGLDIACTKVADLNNDGKPDIVATGTGTLNAQVLLGNGDGAFTRGQNLFSGGFGPQCLSIGQLSGDGNDDLAIVNSSSTYVTGDVAIMDGDGSGRFSLAATYPVGLLPWASSIADFNKTGRRDIAVANTGPPASVSILYANGDGTFKAQVMYPM
jgi:hypothetical protein